MGDPPIPSGLHSSTEAPSAGRNAPSPLFAAPPPEPSNRGKIIGVAIGLALLAILVAILFLRGGKTTPTSAQNAVLPVDAYALNLVFSQLAMSESTSLSGGKSTFIDGHVKNAGPNTVTGITLQVLFRNDVGLSPQVETLPLTLIRTHEPYVDTEPVSAAPLKPGDEDEFRLILETVTPDWNQQMPDLLVVGVTKR